MGTGWVGAQSLASLFFHLRFPIDILFVRFIDT